MSLLSMTLDLKLASVNKMMSNLGFSSKTEFQLGKYFLINSFEFEYYIKVDSQINQKAKNLYLPKVSPLYFFKAHVTIPLAVISPL